MSSLLRMTIELEVSKRVLQHQFERAVSQIDLPLVVPGVLPINLGRLAGGRVEAFDIDSNGVALALSFERGRRSPVRIDVQLAGVRFAAATQTLTLKLERLRISGLTPLSALVNPLRAQLLAGAVRGANERLPGLLSVLEGTELEIHLDVLTNRALQESDARLRSALEQILPVPAHAELHVLGLELKTEIVWARVEVRF